MSNDNQPGSGAAPIDPLGDSRPLGDIIGIASSSSLGFDFSGFGGPTSPSINELLKGIDTKMARIIQLLESQAKPKSIGRWVYSDGDSTGDFYTWQAAE